VACSTMRALAIFTTPCICPPGYGGVREFGPFLVSYRAYFVRYYTNLSKSTILAAVCKTKPLNIKSEYAERFILPIRMYHFVLRSSRLHSSQIQAKIIETGAFLTLKPPDIAFLSSPTTFPQVNYCKFLLTTASSMIHKHGSVVTRVTTHEFSRVMTVTALPAVGDALELALACKHPLTYQLLLLVLGTSMGG
jgi:hypothetical protein